MILLKGQGVSRGVVKGPLCFYRRQEREDIQKSGKTPEEEKARLMRAQQEAIGQLHELAERCRGDMREAADVFEAHAMLAEDEDFISHTHALIDSERCSAEYAVRQAEKRFSGMLSELDDPYMQARAADIRDIADRIIGNLMNVREQKMDFTEPVVLAADDFTPSETVRLDPKMILGFITGRGSASSHTAILARTMGIPAVCGLGEALREEYEGRTIYVDGEAGYAFMEPDAQMLADFEDRQQKQQEGRRMLESMKGMENITPDGRKILIYCNIASPADVRAVLENDGEGIGLFRSEFLYLASEDYPDEEAQFCVYRDVAAAMGGRRVIIRTLDIGADKQAGYFGIRPEENPALGMRGIRISLSRPDVFRTQLRALYRASAYGKIAIMFPMIASVWEVRECRSACRKTMAELEREGIDFDRNVEIGVMIETPASVLIADDLAKEVDFFSVGTNDLTQYTLACDRQAGDLGRFFDPHHPALLRSIAMAADAAHEAGIWIGVCGELAADRRLLSAFLEAGIDELSVAPADVLPLRMEIRRNAGGQQSKINNHFRKGL